MYKQRLFIWRSIRMEQEANLKFVGLIACGFESRLRYQYSSVFQQNKKLECNKASKIQKVSEQNTPEKRRQYRICTTTMKNEEIAKWMAKLSIRLPLLAETAVVMTSWLQHTTIKTLVSGVDAADMNLVVELITLNGTTILICEGADLLVGPFIFERRKYVIQTNRMCYLWI